MLEYPQEILEPVCEETPLLQPSLGFLPKIPETLAETGLTEVIVEDLVLKGLLGKGVMSGRDLAHDLCIPFKVMNPVLSEMKNRMLVSHRTTAAVGDFFYALTETGKTQAIQARAYSAYYGPAPVVFKDYLASIAAQSIRSENPSVNDLKKAYADIVLEEEMLTTLGPAINSGRGIFLFGEPGNGKTTIAERIRNCFSGDIYIPHILWIDGELVQLFDPQSHEPVEPDPAEKPDTRWIKIRRPMVMVGGELMLDSLEIRYNPTLKVSEAPLQMKANGGTFLIDDFGRQRVDHRDLLNRWIVPLEKRFDFLVLPNGKKIQVPFDELIIFSTNLNPQELVDDAFLRRIPYKIEIENPTEDEFRTVFRYQCDKYNIPYEEAMVDYLIEHHYRGKRGYRKCHPRDVLDQIINMSYYTGDTPRMTHELLDLACKTYFAAMACSIDAKNNTMGMAS